MIIVVSFICVLLYILLWKIVVGDIVLSAVVVEFNPGHWMSKYSSVLVNLASRSYSIVSLFAEGYDEVSDEDIGELFYSLNEYIARGDIAGIARLLDGLSAEQLYGLIEAVGESVRRVLGGFSIFKMLKVLRRRYPWIPEIRDPRSAFLYITCLLRLAYLYTSNEMARVASIFGYLAARITEIQDQIEMVRAALYFYASALLVLNNKIKEGLSLLGWGMRKHLEIKPLYKVSIAEKPEVWEANLEVNYYLDIAPLVDGKILDELGFFEYIDEMRQ